MLVDSHCHLNCLDLTRHEGSLDNALKAAETAGVDQLLCVCIDLEHLPEVLAIAERYPNVTASVGLHPNEQIEQEPSVADLVRMSKHPKVVALGETGLDYFRSQGDLSWQQNRFRTHIQAAIETQKPLIVHSRQAPEDTIKILQAENAQQVGGVLHCFCEGWAMAQAGLALNFMISFSGIVTFKNAKELQAVAQKVPLDKMLIETDSPYLAPVPFRGKPNEPAYVRFVAEKIAELKGLSYDEVCKQTTANFNKLFKAA